MAHVIAVCGSGGKTTLVKSLAKRYANENKKVCITTTTHMWYDDDVKESLILGSNVDVVSGKVYYISNLNKKKELITSLNEDDYKIVCDKFDYVIVEADGSRSMPMKIPHSNEPAIPNNVDEIIIVVGMEAIGREIGIVCHRFNEFYGNDKYLNDNDIKAETIVTEELLDSFVRHYYFTPLKEKYSSSKVSIYKCRFGNNKFFDESKINNNQLLAIVLCASGFSRRFGENKLMIDIRVKQNCSGEARESKGDRQCDSKTVGAKHCEPAISKKLYQVMIDKLLGAKEKVIDKFSINEEYKDLKINVLVVSQYDEILNDESYKNKVIMIKNDNASEGLSESIKLAVRFCKGSEVSPLWEGSSTEGNLLKFRPYDAMVFVNADMPLLPECELSNFIYNSILNKNGIAAMYTDDIKNPAYFEKKYFDELLKLEGDKGARELLDNHFKELYKYYINEKYLIDIDVKEDLKLLNCY